MPIFIGGRAYGNLYLTEKKGAEEFTEADEEAVVLLAEFAGLAIDHAHRYARSEASRRDLERKIAALDATVTIARTLAAQTDLEVILDLVAKRGRALVSARALAIELKDGDELVVAAAAGEIPAGLVGAHLDAESSVAGAALRSLRSERLETSVNRARYAEFGLGSLGLAADAGLIIPLTLRGRSYGVLIAVDRQGDGGPKFSIEDEELLESFASSGATAVATAQIFDAARRRDRLAAGEAERTRWARELHDETLQGLAALRMSLAAMEGAEPSAARQLIQRAARALRRWFSAVSASPRCSRALPPSAITTRTSVLLSVGCREVSRDEAPRSTEPRLNSYSVMNTGSTVSIGFRYWLDVGPVSV